MAGAFDFVSANQGLVYIEELFLLFDGHAHRFLAIAYKAPGGMNVNAMPSWD